MHERLGTFVERLNDTGQWFERGVRVEYVPAKHDPRMQVLETAALGSYEVLGCVRVTVDHHRWLDVRLRRLTHCSPFVACAAQLSGSPANDGR